MRAKLTSTSSVSQADRMHRLVIGAPLLIVAVFCFGFFMMHPSQTDAVRSNATSDPDHKSAPPATKSADIQPVSTLPAADTSSSSSDGSSSDTTGSSDTNSPSPGTGSDNQSSHSPAPASTAGSRSASPPAASKAPADTKAPAANNNGGGELIQTVVNGVFGGR